MLAFSILRSYSEACDLWSIYLHRILPGGSGYCKYGWSKDESPSGRSATFLVHPYFHLKFVIPDAMNKYVNGCNWTKWMFSGGPCNCRNLAILNPPCMHGFIIFSRLSTAGHFILQIPRSFFFKSIVHNDHDGQRLRDMRCEWFQLWFWSNTGCMWGHIHNQSWCPFQYAIMTVSAGNFGECHVCFDVYPGPILWLIIVLRLWLCLEPAHL